jgi:hypothetical protein
MMMLLLQQQQNKVKSISDSHRGTVQQKINNFVDAPLQGAASTHKDPEGSKKVNQSTDFALLNNNKMAP